MKVLLIASGAYVDDELAAELGRLPPAFLPAKNRRLIELQLDEFKTHFDRLYLSLPSDYVLSELDRRLLDRQGVQVVWTSPDFSISESITSSLTQILADGVSPIAKFSVLYGDTLLRGILHNVDCGFAVGSAAPEYAWASVDVQGDRIAAVSRTVVPSVDAPVLSGFFAFASINQLLTPLMREETFEAALNALAVGHSVEVINATAWLDFGHVHTYFQARKHLTTERAFNSLVFKDRALTKRSTRDGRVASESAWYSNLPSHLRAYTPQFLGKNGRDDEYSLEYLFLSPLSDLFVFGDLPMPTWRGIFMACREMIDAFQSEVHPGNITVDSVDYSRKLRNRLAEFESQPASSDVHSWLSARGLPPLQEVADASERLLRDAASPQLTVIHGDLCFSNVLFDFRTKSVKVIDPRGESFTGAPTLWGDPRYELAKLYHSAVGLYDLVVAKRMEVDDLTNVNIDSLLSQNQLHARSAFLESFLPESEQSLGAVVHALAMQLFLTMLPLHNDDEGRQLMLAVNAVRLYKEGPPCRRG